MKRASRLLTDEQRGRINAAVGRAESGTAAEIVPVLATASGRYDRAEDVVGLWLGVIAMAGVYVALPAEANEPGSWGGYATGLRLLWLVLAMLVGFIIGALVAGWVPNLRRLFTPTKQMGDEVARRAREAFFDASIHHTGGGTGVLIFISLYERRAAILADRQVIEKLGQPAIDHACSTLTGSLKTSDVTTALVATLDELSPALAEALPRAADDVNEHPDELVTID